jgi:hypothetical protein
MKKLDYFNFSNLRNNEHFEMVTSFDALIQKFTAEQLGIQDLYPVFKAYFQEEDSRIRIERGSAKSEEIRKKDKDRDQTWNSISKAVEAALICPIEAQVDSAIVLRRVIDLYGDKRKADYPAETASLSSLVTDLLSDTNVVHLNALHITEWVQALRDENNEFRDIFTNRNAELSNRLSGDVHIARDKVEPALEEITDRINASIVMNLAKAEVEGFVNEYNELVKYYKNILSVRDGRNNKDDTTDTQKK